MTEIRIVTTDPEQTRRFAETLAQLLKPGDVLGLVGCLGCGKTTFVQGVARGLGFPEESYVNSPTYALCNRHETRPPLVHYDLYRLEELEELEELGLEDGFGGGDVIAVEWFDRWPELHPLSWLEVRFTSKADRHEMHLLPHGKEWEKRLENVPMKVE